MNRKFSIKICESLQQPMPAKTGRSSRAWPSTRKKELTFHLCLPVQDFNTNWIIRTVSGPATESAIEFMIRKYWAIPRSKVSMPSLLLNSPKIQSNWILNTAVNSRWPRTHQTLTTIPTRWQLRQPSDKIAPLMWLVKRHVATNSFSRLLRPHLLPFQWENRPLNHRKHQLRSNYLMSLHRLLNRNL